MNSNIIDRPKTLREVAERSDSLAAFGVNLRDWQHEISRSGLHSRPELARRLQPPPPRLAGRMDGGDIADAYLAAYAEWIADQAGIPRPPWCREPERVAAKPWFATELRGYLLAVAPASFRQRNLFTVPEPVFVSRPGRPRVSEESKRLKACRRQKAYRQRMKSLVEQARAAGLKP